MNIISVVCLRIRFHVSRVSVCVCVCISVFVSVFVSVLESMRLYPMHAIISILLPSNLVIICWQSKRRATKKSHKTPKDQMNELNKMKKKKSLSENMNSICSAHTICEIAPKIIAHRMPECRTAESWICNLLCDAMAFEVLYIRFSFNQISFAIFAHNALTIHIRIIFVSLHIFLASFAFCVYSISFCSNSLHSVNRCECVIAWHGFVHRSIFDSDLWVPFTVFRALYFMF